MKNNNLITASSQIETIVPNYVYTQYSDFIDFMQKSVEANERIGFGLDLLYNLRAYSDFDNYNDEIVEFGTLTKTLGEEVTDELHLADGFGFPEENGVLLIDEEVILYRYRTGNVCYELQRAASATTVLPSVGTPGKYITRTAARHGKGSEVQNISVLFLVSILSTIHKSYTPNIDSAKVSPEVNRSSLLQNIKDFFASKGSKLGVKALFKMIYGVNDVDVKYPGDRMIKPSDSTWYVGSLMRSYPLPKQVTFGRTGTYVTPEKTMGTTMQLTNYRTGKLIASAFSDYITSYPWEDTTQYEWNVAPEDRFGTLTECPNTFLTRYLNNFGSGDDNKDVTTITVESTVGFPDKGVIFIDQEGIFYDGKTFNQFLNCQRGYVSEAREHATNSKVWGEIIIRTEYTNENQETFFSESWPSGLVRYVEIDKPGLLQTLDDQITTGGPGRVDPALPTLNYWDENYFDELVRQDTQYLQYVENYTWGLNGVFFDDEFVYLSTSNLPAYVLQDFSDDGSVGSEITGENSVYIIPNHDKRKKNVKELGKGSDIIGVAADGVPFYSPNAKENTIYGAILRYNVTKQGSGYINPTVFVEGGSVAQANITNGRVTSIDVVTSNIYDYIPKVEIADGRKGRIKLTFDNYGRIATATVANPGEGYRTVPTIRVTDKTGRGNGAYLVCKLSAGQIKKVIIKNPGKDYNQNSTTATVVSAGKGAQAVAVVEEYTRDNYALLRQNRNEFLDNNNAFLFEDEDGNNTRFAYLSNPVDLRKKLGDNGLQHSPILGWAVDGNPIYGPFAYANGVDASDGLDEQVTGFYLPEDRALTIPANGTERSIRPPSPREYPLGSFIQDYVYDPLVSAIRGGKLRTELAENLLTDPSSTQRCNVATTEDLGLATYNNGTDGVGATLTNADFNQQLFMDTLLVLDGDIILVKDQFDQTQNGVYVVTEAGSPTTPWVLTRKDNYDSPSDFPGSTMIVLEGFENISDGFACDQASPPVIGTDPITFSRSIYIGNENIRWTEKASSILDENNGKICNTPEFPADLYPEGVYCYFLTSYGEVGSYPYAIGNRFQNRPVSQNLRLISDGKVIETNSPASSYDNNVIRRDFDKTYRRRNPYLQATADELEADISQYADLSSGEIETMRAEDGNIDYVAVGDTIIFDNEGTGGGFGAAATVTYIAPRVSVVSEGELNQPAPGGEEITTRVFSHKQRVYLGADVNENETLTFPEGFIINAKPSGAVAQVTNYNQTKNLLTVRCTSKQLIQFGDTFKDAKKRKVRMPDDPQANAAVFGSDIVGGVSTHLNFSDPTDTSTANAGDLWWSTETGRLYIFYKEENEETGQWVVAFPTGSRSFGEGGSNVLIEVPGDDDPINTNIIQDLTENVIAIRETAPSRRTDGTANKRGDLWWSTYTGQLYIYNQDDANNAGGAEYNWTSEWVCTSPSGSPSYEISSDTANYEVIAAGGGPDYEDNVRVVIAESTPVLLPDGNPVVQGTLWWCTANGRMYIYYVDADSPQWVVTNPTGTYAHKTGLNKLVIGDGSDEKTPLSILPEGKNQKVIWVEADLYSMPNIKNFQVGDQVEISSGVPGGVSTSEIATIVGFEGEHQIRLKRAEESYQIPHGAIITNRSRYIYRVVTLGATGISEGFVIRFNSPLNPELDGDHIVEYGGTVTVAGAEADISEGAVVGVNVVNPGNNYFDGGNGQFYVSFVGGGGVGAFGIANVVNGLVVSVDVLEGGVNYSSRPAVIFDSDNSDESFVIFVDAVYPHDPNLFFDTDDLTLQNFINTRFTEVRMDSGGGDYTSLPKCAGAKHRPSENAVLQVFTDVVDGSITSVKVKEGGSRYVNPVIDIVDDSEGTLVGTGSGAVLRAVVVDGIIAEVVVDEPGSGYLNPITTVYEPGGTVSMTTTNIGSVNHVTITNPGRNISSEKSLEPELIMDVRIVYTRVTGYSFDFREGDIIYQGSDDQRWAEGVIDEYDYNRNLIKLSNITGKFIANRMIYGPVGTGGLCTMSGQGDLRIDVSGATDPEGRFITNKSMVSESYPVIQDSKYYQYFSYEIQSPLQKVNYEDIVKSTVHPAGFELFSKIQVSDEVEVTTAVNEIVINAQQFSVTDYGTMISSYPYDLLQGGDVLDLLVQGADLKLEGSGGASTYDLSASEFIIDP